MSETSFDHAVHGLERAFKWWGEGKKNVRAINTAKLRSEADTVVGVLNGFWLAHACCIVCMPIFKFSLRACSMIAMKTPMSAC